MDRNTIWSMKEKQSEVQSESDVKAPHQETSASEQKNARARVQRCISKGSGNLNDDHNYEMKNLIQRLDLTQQWEEIRKQGLKKGTGEAQSPGTGESEFAGNLEEKLIQLLHWVWEKGSLTL